MTGYVDALHRELISRNVDLLIVRSPGDLPDDKFEFKFLFDDHYVVAADAKNRWANRRKVQLSELMNEPWVLPPPTSVIGSMVSEAFRAEGLVYPRVTVVTDSPHSRVTLLATGRFITVFPTSALTFLTRGSPLKALPVALPGARRPNGILTLKGRALTPVAQLFAQTAFDLAKRSQGKTK